MTLKFQQAVFNLNSMVKCPRRWLAQAKPKAEAGHMGQRRGITITQGKSQMGDARRCIDRKARTPVNFIVQHQSQFMVGHQGLSGLRYSRHKLSQQQKEWLE